MTLRQKYPREYSSWHSMKTRCNNPNSPDYVYYGKRGITVCERWNTLGSFILDMGTRPEGMTLDRVNNDKGYSPSNCRWSSSVRQNNNQRKRCTNTSGITGVYWHKTRKDWQVEFQGTFLSRTKDFFKACCLRKSAEAHYRANN